MIENHFSTKKKLFILLFSALTSFFTYAEEGNASNNNHNQHDANVGKRLFNGLIRQPGQEMVNCASCHNVFPTDTFNWNPSAMAIAISTEYMGFDAFKEILMSPASKKLMESHQNINLSDEQIKQVRLYLQELRHEGDIEPKPMINQLLGFILCVLLLLFSITDLIVLKKVKPKLIHGILILGSLGFITSVLVEEAIALGRQHNYEPNQPIKFSHKVHAGDNQIDCLYCHHTAEDSKSAGIPSMSLCLNCHTIVKEGTHSGKFEIRKIDESMDNGKPVEWIRVHNLPDHVYFNHAQHVAVGKLDCQECHGPVEEMDRVYQYSDLSMGWCLDCHRTHKVQFLENDYYNVYEKFHEDIRSGKIDSVIVSDVGGQDCMKCHY
jgi:cytochrome c553